MISEPAGGAGGANGTDATLRAAAERTWDAVVVGAGPAGGTAAALLADRGWRVLLLDRSRWPRDKVCGGCLNATAVRLLHEMGLERVLCGSVPLQRTLLRARGGRSSTIALPGGAAINRCDLDAGIVDEFLRRGGRFIPGVSATLLPEAARTAMRTLLLRSGCEQVNVQSRIVLTCDGLGGTSLAREPWASWQVERGSLIGFSAPAPLLPIEPGDIHMNVSPSGYVGLTRFTGDAIHLAAALDPTACQAFGGPWAVARHILQSCGWTGIENGSPAQSRGTPLLTRHRTNLAGHRVMAIGDACGYVEPFTGEGIAWAIGGACEAVALLTDPTSWPRDLPARWKRVHGVTIARQQHRCRAVRLALREPMLAQLGVSALRRMPWLATLVTGTRRAPPPQLMTLSAARERERFA